jgi:hypothetical protein
MDLDEPTRSEATAAAETTAPWPPLDASASGSFRWLRPGELLAFPVPTAALQLDAVLRHLEIDGELSDWTAAAVHLAQAHATWQRLEPALVGRIASRAHLSEARAASEEVSAAIARAGDAVKRSRGRSLVRHARRAIEHVAVIERAFE